MSKQDAMISHLDKNDHLTKRSGGKATHGGFKMPEQPQRSTSVKSGSTMKEVVGPSSSSNYGTGAKGAHGGKAVAPHGYNKPASGKKMSK